jgi:hypothetical protein
MGEHGLLFWPYIRVSGLKETFPEEICASIQSLYFFKPNASVLIPSEATGLTSTEALTINFFVAGKEVGQVKLSRMIPKFGLVVFCYMY